MTITASEANEFRIRPARRSDLLDVVRIERSAFPQPWPWRAFERFLDEPGFLVASDGRVVRGYVVADRVETVGIQVGHVKDLAVHPSHRREGIGSSLLERAISVLATNGVAHVKLEVRSTNEAAIDLYRRHGFETHHVVSEYYDDGEDAFIMVLKLKE